MKECSDIECEEITIPLFRGRKEATLPRLLSSTWQTDSGETAYIVVNPEGVSVNFKINGEEFTAPPLNAVLIVR